MAKARATPASVLPDWSEQQLQQLDNWLGIWIDHMVQAALRCREAEKVGGGSISGNNAQYWESGAGCVRWMRGKLRGRRKPKETPETE